MGRLNKIISKKNKKELKKSVFYRMEQKINSYVRFH